MPLLSTLQWVSVVVAGLIALAAFLRAQHASRKIDRLTESYWELRYDYGQLRARVGQLEGQPAGEVGARQTEPASTNFVPLSSLKK